MERRGMVRRGGIVGKWRNGEERRDGEAKWDGGGGGMVGGKEGKRGIMGGRREGGVMMGREGTEEGWVGE